MKFAPLNQNRKLLLANIFLISSSLFCSLKIIAQTQQLVADTAIRVIDGSTAPYNKALAGDTIYLKTGTRDKLLIRNFKGAAGKPITFINQDSIVIISTNSYYGISIFNCRYIRFSGQGDKNNFYGIQIKQVLGGSGIGIGGMSSDVEIDHVSIENCRNSGIIAKTDPDCSFKTVRDSFIQFNTSMHDNYISHVGNEGMYIGSSYYSGVKLKCNGIDTMLMPAVLNAVQIYNNLVDYPGWDGIQVSSAPLHCNIYSNTVLHDSQAEEPNQMSGILIGGGSKCDCYNNLIADGKGDGIEDHGLAGNKLYNNIIVNAGKTYLPNDLTQMKHGIFVSDISAVKDSSFTILFNDIINPKSDGIRLYSSKSKNNLVASNLIINPGNFDLYESDNTSFTGNDAYVMYPYAPANLQKENNFFAKSISDAGISATNYAPLNGSPLINKGYQKALWLTTDFGNKSRPYAGKYDIGAIESNAINYSQLDTPGKVRPILFPNPVQTKLNIRYITNGLEKTMFQVYNLKGELVLQYDKEVLLPGLQQLNINVNNLSFGMYIYSLTNGKEINYGRFLKL